jgi:hypothetical protein
MTQPSPTDPPETSPANEPAQPVIEIAQLRKALAATEAELLRLRQHRSLEMARLERQVYWLDRWGLDLDAWMQRRPVRALFSVLRFARRLIRKLRARRKE